MRFGFTQQLNLILWPTSLFLIDIMTLFICIMISKEHEKVDASLAKSTR